MSLVFLVGMPGAGKTYWGVQLSAALGLSFIDLDKYIEEQAGATVSHIFQESGEAVFREKETLALQALVANAGTQCIIACGGGTPIFGDNLHIMKAAGCVIYLKASFDTLLANLQRDHTDRPLLKQKDPTLLLQDLFEKRRAYYEQAHYILDVENLSVPTFAQIIAQCTDRPF